MGGWRQLPPSGRSPGQARADDGPVRGCLPPAMSTYLLRSWQALFTASRRPSRLRSACTPAVAGRHLRRDAEEIFAITRLVSTGTARSRRAYPYDSYDQAFVPELEAGRWRIPAGSPSGTSSSPVRRDPAERQTRGVVIAHEMATLVGDLVTMRLVNRRVVSESFAEYMVSRSCLRPRVHRDVDRLRPGPQAPRLRRGPAPVHPPVAPEPRECQTPMRRSPTTTSLRQGASVLRPARDLAGRPTFLAGINDSSRGTASAAPTWRPAGLPEPASGTDVRGGRALAGHGRRDTLTVSRPGPAARAWSSLTARRPHRIWLGVYTRTGRQLALRPGSCPRAGRR